MKNIVTHQAELIYAVVAESKDPLTAAQISRKINVLAPAVHRAIKQLTVLGVISSFSVHPRRYQAVTDQSALRSFLLSQKKDFLRQFPSFSARTTSGSDPRITFIHSREDLLKMTDRDVSHASVSVDFIVSGLEVPDETVLAYRGALQRGVRIRAIVQKKHDTTTGKLERWKTIGIGARCSDLVDARIFIIDQKITYITSYDSHIKNRAVGVRMEYESVSLIMSELFEEKWLSAFPLL